VLLGGRDAGDVGPVDLGEAAVDLRVAARLGQEHADPRPRRVESPQGQRRRLAHVVTDPERDRLDRLVLELVADPVHRHEDLGNGEPVVDHLDDRPTDLPGDLFDPFGGDAFAPELPRKALDRVPGPFQLRDHLVAIRGRRREDGDRPRGELSEPRQEPPQAVRQRR
jgi:hypothetical protein